MSGFGGGFGGSTGFGAGGFGSTTTPLAAPTFGAAPSSLPGPSSTSTPSIFGSSPNISTTTGFGGGGGFGSFSGSTSGSTLGGFGSSAGGMGTGIGGGGGGFGFGSSTTSSAFPSAPFNATSTSGGFGSTPSSSTPSSLGGFGGFGANSSTFSSGGGGGFGTNDSADMGFEDATTPSFGTTTTPFPTSGFGASSSGGFGTTPPTFGTTPATSTGGGFGAASGFGTSTTTTTFGSAAPPTLTTFGGTNSGGFGTPITFGSAPNTASTGGFAGSGGGGFGPSSTAFGSASATSMGGFGANSTGGGFGTSTAFGGAVSSTTSTGGFGTSTGGGFGTSMTFGNAPLSSTSGGFGGSTTGEFGTPSGGFGTSSTPSFGGTTPSGGFGTSTTFGTSPGIASFGTSTGTTTTSSGTGFGTGTGGMFSPATAPSSDFVASSAGFGTAPTMAFGASSNVVTGSSSNQPLRFGQSNNTGWHPKPTANPFAPSNSQDDGMMGDETTTPQPNVSNPQPTFSTSNNMAFGRSPIRTGFQATTSPIPEENEMGEDDGDDDDDFSAAAKQRADEEARLKAKIEEKKRILQEKIEEKRKKLMEKQRQKREQSTTPEVTSSQDAQDSAPTNKALAERNAVRFGDQEKSLAERNAIRFGEQDRSSTREMLPPAMRVKAERVTPPPVISNDSDQQRSTEREDLKTAKALVGTCQHFCPEEELLRREREGDIQQLEIPLPGKLHPPHWTLQQTAVKRFRRSAADYKLDVPEWVRPPDVLEQVCGYLEEWVMERDRQGPDPRFPQGQTPPPLEVYQFIWDRTRMIRKDFTLQNYVGTGGKCDARAVRCHERIARWHAMCEHQLSHIPEFVTMQSQQNIQELGQTMKTLNQFYDDSLKRATVEVPNENGQETRLDLTGFSHGCTSNSVQGQSPLEFDGSELNNNDHDPQVAKRILGKHAVNHPARGTAEPEMRGLYMLLTMNNEGGMEVLKNAARLFQERPDIYASKPVQLALEIFKAKKEYNYARFFSILRAPTTPYLFCCIMFKHVELMRKIAFRIMSKSFGARKKDTGEAIYDAYPLSRLVELLCFEDVDEARAACTHYNITVKQVQASASREEVAEIIFWRASEFKEPIHPEKGYVLPLQPRKMTRIIEQKLHGATRLAVCRGEVSGEGATVQAVAPAIALGTIHQSHENTLNVPLNVPQKNTSEDEQADLLVERQKEEAQRIEQETVLREKERLQREREQQKKEEERRAQEAKQKQAKELEKQRLLRELELQKQEAEKLEEQRKKEKIEKEAIAERIREETKRRELEAEAKKRQEEEERQKAEEERRAAEETRRRDEEARMEKERLHRIAEEQRRKEEAERQALLRRERERKLEQEAEEKRKANEWEDKVNAARRLILWRRWQNRLSRSIVMTKGSAASLEQVDPTFLSHTLKLGSWFQNARMEKSEHDADEALQAAPRDIRRAIDACIRGKSPKISLSGIVVREMAASQQLPASTDSFDGATADAKTTLLLKVALLIPSLDGNDSQSFLDLLKSWIHSRIGLNEVFTEELRSNGACTSFEARSIVRHCRNAQDISDCDVALILVPPPWSTSDDRRRKLSSIRSLIDDSLPRIALVLGEFDHEGHEYMKTVLAETLGTTNGALPIVCTRSATPMALEKALDSSLNKLAKIFVNESCIKVDRISVPRLVARAVSMGLWNSGVSGQQVLDCDVVLETARSAVSAFIESANIQVLENEGAWSFWPSSDFVSQNGVDSYFSNDAHLPKDWISSLSRQSLDQELSLMTQRLTGSFRDVVESFLLEAPTEIREECGMLISRGYYRRGLQAAMHWFSVHSQANKSTNSYIYFPRGLMEVIFDEIEFTDQGVGTRNSAPPALLLPQDNVLLDTIEEIDQTMKKATEPSPHFESYDISILASVNNNKRRHHDTTPTEGKTQSPSMTRDFVEAKKFRPSGQLLPNSKVDLKESAAFSQRLQNLMMGATVELEVGEDYLSNILRHAPELSHCL